MAAAIVFETLDFTVHFCRTSGRCLSVRALTAAVMKQEPSGRLQARQLLNSYIRNAEAASRSAEADFRCYSTLYLPAK